MVKRATFPRPVAGNPLRLLAVTGNLLYPDHDGGSQHMLALFRGFVRAGCRVTYYAAFPQQLKTFAGSPQQAAEFMTREGIDVALSPDRPLPLANYLAQFGNSFDYIMLWPENIAMEIYPLVKQFAPQARVIFNTIDLAHVRLFRKARVSSNLPAIQSAIQAKRREVWLTNHCDTTLVVSEPERQTLAAMCPEADIRVIPSVWPLVHQDRSFAERQGLLFVGSFPYEANADAVRYMIDAIYPLIADALGDVPFYIVGAAPTPELVALSRSNPQFIITGQVPSVEPYFAMARVCVAPMRYGAGIKTKLLYSMSCGLPVVTSTIGAEGLHMEDGRAGFVVDEPSRFAEATIRLYQDEALWLRVAGQAQAVIAKHFSAQALDAALDELIRPDRSGEVARTGISKETGGVGD